jgi:hypothetical protein
MKNRKNISDGKAGLDGEFPDKKRKVDHIVAERWTLLPLFWPCYHCITASLHHWPQLAEEKLCLTGRIWRSLREAA